MRYSLKLTPLLFLVLGCSVLKSFGQAIPFQKGIYVAPLDPFYTKADLYLREDHTFVFLIFSNDSVYLDDRSYYGSWEIIEENHTSQRISFKVDNDWFYIAEEKYDSTIYPGRIAVCLLSEGVDTCTFFTYIVNETGPAYNVFRSPKANEPLRTIPRSYAFRSVPQEPEIFKVTHPRKHIPVDSITVQIHYDWRRISTYISKVTNPTCEDCNSFLIHSKFDVSYMYMDGPVDFVGGTFLIKGDTIFTKDALGYNLGLVKSR